MKIYTKTGDDGTTGLLGGGRVAKYDARIEALGEIDEANAAVGLSLTLARGNLQAMLSDIQRTLFEVGSEVAVAKDFEAKPASLCDGDVVVLEESIDALSEEMPALESFILPGGSELAARLHYARVVCRRCERSLWRLAGEAELRPIIMTYLNRLSDWLFVAARWANFSQGVRDVEWHPRGRS
jgi:cob(I)alamin adenosyltransferase